MRKEETRETLKETFKRVNKEYKEHYPVYVKAKDKFLDCKGKTKGDLERDFQIYKPIRDRHQAFLKELDRLESLIYG